MVSDVADGRWQREHDVEVGHREQLALALFHLLSGSGALALWAMPVTTAVVGDDGVLAVLAARDVAAKRRRAAALDGAHHLHLSQAHVTAVGLTPSGAVVAEDIRDLTRGTGLTPGDYAGGFSASARSVPFVFATGCDRLAIPERYKNVGIAYLGLAPDQHHRVADVVCCSA